jgi:hypothetical protein
VDEFLAGGSSEECPNDVGVSYVGQLDALSGEASNVLIKSLIRFLVVAPKIPGITRANIDTLEVSHENLYKVSPVVDASGREMF